MFTLLQLSIKLWMKQPDLWQPEKAAARRTLVLFLCCVRAKETNQVGLRQQGCDNEINSLVVNSQGSDLWVIYATYTFPLFIRKWKRAKHMCCACVPLIFWQFHIREWMNIVTTPLQYYSRWLFSSITWDQVVSFVQNKSTKLWWWKHLKAVLPNSWFSYWRTKPDMCPRFHNIFVFTFSPSMNLCFSVRLRISTGTSSSERDS